MLPRKIPKAPKRSSRWRSQAHLNFVRRHACSVCGSEVAIEVAHVRIGSNAGMGQKPSDWRTVSLCKVHHGLQHAIGEATFWNNYKINYELLIQAFCDGSPKAAEIRKVRADG